MYTVNIIVNKRLDNQDRFRFVIFVCIFWGGGAVYWWEWSNRFFLLPVNPVNMMLNCYSMREYKTRGPWATSLT